MPITPYLFYEDVAAARRFLARAFGFKNFGPMNRNKDGTLIHAAMKLGNDIVMMGFPGPKYKSPRKLGQATQCIYIEVKDADQLYARARKSGATILDELKDTPFGQRRFGAEDPEGHQWYFGHQMKHRTAKQR
jgi:PhnB protein